MSKMTVKNLQTLPGNAVVYSDAAWAVARKASGGQDVWFPDHGASITSQYTSEELLEWTDDWEQFRWIQR